MLRELIVIAAGVLGLTQAALAGEAGKIIFAAGQADISGLPAKLDASVQEGALLTTGADGYIYMKTVDDGLLVLRPSSQARIVAYHIDKENPANTRVKLELLKGVARSQSGNAVKLARQNFRFNTPVAAIGVRGTDFTVFTDQDTSRVAVISGGVVVSGFSGNCLPTGNGPCGGGGSIELYAAQKGQLLEVKRGQAQPQMREGGALAPDLVAPPRTDEPLGSAGNSGAPRLDAKKDASLQLHTQALPTAPAAPTTPPVVPELPEVPVVTEPPVVVGPPVDPVVPPVLLPPDPRLVSWGRWQPVLDRDANATLAKEGAERIAANEVYVLFRSTKGDPYVTPERGNIAFALKSSEASVRDTATLARTLATVDGGTLAVDFGTASYTTKLDVTHDGARYALASQGKVYKEGLINGVNNFQPSNNINVTGLLDASGGATYLFEGNLAPRKVISGVTVWGK